MNHEVDCKWCYTDLRREHPANVNMIHALGKCAAPGRLYAVFDVGCERVIQVAFTKEDANRIADQFSGFVIDYGLLS